MAITLNNEELLSAASLLQSEDKLPRAEYDALVAAVQNAQNALAVRIAEIEGVECYNTSYEPGFGGMYSDFRPGPGGKLSALLAGLDEGGEWGQ